MTHDLWSMAEVTINIHTPQFRRPSPAEPYAQRGVVLWAMARYSPWTDSQRLALGAGGNHWENGMKPEIFTVELFFGYYNMYYDMHYDMYYDIYI